MSEKNKYQITSTKLFCTFLLFFLDHFAATAQNTIPVAHFHEDSAKVGEPIPLSLTFYSPEGQEVLFPDSTYDFSPFEWVDQQWFPTRSAEGKSRDSVVYALRYFELDTTQKISLPVFVLRGEKDTLKIHSDSVALTANFVVKVMPDSLHLRQNTQFVPFRQQANGYLLALVALAVLLLASGVWALFGGRILRAMRLRRMEKQFEKFKESYLKLIQESPDGEQTDHALGIWKAYLSKLLRRPLSGHTTREFRRDFPEAREIHEALRQLDRAIYAGESNDKTRDALETLLDFAATNFQQHKKEVNNA